MRFSQPTFWRSSFSFYFKCLVNNYGESCNKLICSFRLRFKCDFNHPSPMLNLLVDLCSSRLLHHRKSARHRTWRRKRFTRSGGASISCACANTNWFATSYVQWLTAVASRYISVAHIDVNLVYRHRVGGLVINDNIANRGSLRLDCGRDNPCKNGRFYSPVQTIFTPIWDHTVRIVLTAGISCFSGSFIPTKSIFAITGHYTHCYLIVSFLVFLMYVSIYRNVFHFFSFPSPPYTYFPLTSLSENRKRCQYGAVEDRKCFFFSIIQFQDLAIHQTR